MNKGTKDGWVRITVHMTPELKELLGSRAKKLNRSVAAHVQRLIQRDVGLKVEEEQAPYIARKLDEGGHPPNPERDPGAGQGAEIPA